MTCNPSQLDYTIIYEVNLSVPKQNSIAYLDYLKDFTRNVCRIVQGFTNAVVYSQPKPGNLFINDILHLY